MQTHAFYTYVQAHDETNASYLSKFKNMVEVIEHYGGSIGDDEVFVTSELKKCYFFRYSSSNRKS